MTLMFQKEVADRIVAAAERRRLWPPGGDLPGRLPRPSVVMDLPARAFTPPPKVGFGRGRAWSRTADRARRRPARGPEKVTAAAFGQRRKMLRSSLKGLGGGALCERPGSIPTPAPRTIDVAGFQDLARGGDGGVSLQLRSWKYGDKLGR